MKAQDAEPKKKQIHIFDSPVESLESSSSSHTTKREVDSFLDSFASIQFSLGHASIYEMAHNIQYSYLDGKVLEFGNLDDSKHYRNCQPTESESLERISTDLVGSDEQCSLKPAPEENLLFSLNHIFRRGTIWYWDKPEKRCVIVEKMEGLVIKTFLIQNSKLWYLERLSKASFRVVCISINPQKISRIESVGKNLENDFNISKNRKEMSSQGIIRNRGWYYLQLLSGLQR